MAPVILPRLFLDRVRWHPSRHQSRHAAAAERTKLERRQTRLAWLLLLPSLAVVALVALYPLAKTIYQSFTDQEFLALTPTKWVGLENYRQLWHDTLFRDSIWMTIKFSLITVTFEFALGLVIALVVSSNFKGRGGMRAVMLVPWAIPTVVAAQMWKWMLDDTFGVVNDLGVRSSPPLALPRLDRRPEHGARRGLRGRHLEDDAVRRAAPARGPAGDSAGPLRGRQG